MDTPASSEEWLGGPYVTMRRLRKLIDVVGADTDLG